MIELRKEREERKLTTVLYIGSVVLLLGLLLITYRNINDYERSVLLVRDRNMTLIELEGQLSSLRDAELSVRGYLLTSDSAFLEPYILAQRNFRDHSARLRLLEAGSADSGTLDQIQEDALEVQRIWRRSIGDRNSDMGQTALLQGVHDGKVAMDVIRKRANMLLKQWRDDRDEMLVKEQTDGVDAPFMLTLYSLLAILATGILFWRLTRTLISHERVRMALRVKVNDLDREVNEHAELQILLQKILNNSPIGIMSFRAVRDGSGSIVDFEFVSSNSMADTLVGRNDLVGKRLLIEMPEHKVNGLFVAYVGVVEEDEPFIREFHYVGSGLDDWFRNHAVKLDDGFLVSFMDITEQKEAQQLHLETERLALTSQITRTVAHEVRNPLTNIHLAIEQLQDETEALEEQTEPFFKIIYRNLERIGRLITEMLESSQKRELNITPCDMGDIVNSVLKAVSDRLELKEMRGVVDIAPDLPQVMVDSELINMAIANLAVNALEAMEAGQGVLVLKAFQIPDAVVLEISDNGKGIPPETIQRLFEPFFTGRNGGLGLGLTAARSIFTGHNIKLDVTSSVGVGSTFTLRFPRSIRVGETRASLAAL